MNADRERLIQTLAYQILGMSHDRDGNQVNKPLPGIDGAGGARLDIEIRGIVHNMRRQIWLDQGAWTKRIVEEIEKQAAEIDLDKYIAERVRAEINQALLDLSAIVKSTVKEAVRERLGNLPELVASAVAERMIDERFK